MKIGLVAPHIFMHEAILPHVIFAPATLALALADGLVASGHDVTLFTPGSVETSARKITADLELFEKELAGRGDNYLDLLKKHPFTFVTLARQVQSEIIAGAFDAANNNELDIVHIYTNEEDIALPFAKLCNKPVVFTHHDPFNFLIKYKSVFSKYKDLNWLSISLAQRKSMPAGTNWLANIYHGLDKNRFQPSYNPSGNYVAYLGRIIESKGVHLEIAAVQKYNLAHPGEKLKLKIAGKHYADYAKDNYWREIIEPEIGGNIEFVGFLKTDQEKQDFLGNARALVVPSIFDEPFGMVLIEALACATPIIGLNSGAIPEIIKHDQTGILVKKSSSELATITDLARALEKIDKINRKKCRQDFEARFTLERMVAGHIAAYKKLIKAQPNQP